MYKAKFGIKNKNTVVSLFLAVFFLAGGFYSCGTLKQANYRGLGQGGDPAPLMAALRTGTLPNGLAYYILENHTPEDRAFFTLAVDGGSVLEDEDEQGLFHFIEHIIFSNTRRFPKPELVNYLRSLGMRFGADANAFTGQERTTYGLEIPLETDEAGRKRIPEKIFMVADDWTQAAGFQQRQIDEERPVILEEYRLRSNGERILWKILPDLFQGSRFGERLPLGAPEVIQTAPPSRMENLYKTWYRTDNMALVFVGDFDGAALEGALASHFTAPPPETPLNHPRYELLPAQKGAVRSTVFTDPELPSSKIYLYHRYSATPRKADLAAFRENLIDDLIDRIINARLENLAFLPETPFDELSFDQDMVGKTSRFFTFVALAKPWQTEKALDALLRERESLLRYGFSAQEIKQAKESLIAGMEYDIEFQDRLHSSFYVDKLVEHFLRGKRVSDFEWDWEAASALLPGIGIREVNKTLKDYLSSGELSVYTIIPEAEDAELDSWEPFHGLVQEAPKFKVPRPRYDRGRRAETAVGPPLLDTPPKPGLIRSESRDPDTLALIWELGNGARVVIKETGNPGDDLCLYALGAGGTAGADPFPAVRLAETISGTSGLGPYTQAELIKRLQGKQASLSFSAQPFFRKFSGFAAKKDLETLFELLYLDFTQPRFDAEETAAMIAEYRAALVQPPNTGEFFFREITSLLANNNPYLVPLKAEDVDRVSPEECYAIFRRMLNPADYLFVITAGKLDEEQLRSLTATYLASIPPGTPWDGGKNFSLVRPGPVMKKLYRGQQTQSTVEMAWFERERFSPAIAASAGVLKEYLDIILTEEIREKRGGAYAITADLTITPLLTETELEIGVSFICDPMRAEELAAAVEEQLRQIAQGTVNRDTLALAVETAKRQYEQSLRLDSVQGESYASLEALLQIPAAAFYQRGTAYAAVKAGDLQKLCQGFVQGGPVTVILFPDPAGRTPPAN